MNGISALAGKDVLIINGQVLTGYADGDGDGGTQPASPTVDVHSGWRGIWEDDASSSLRSNHVAEG